MYLLRLITIFACLTSPAIAYSAEVKVLTWNVYMLAKPIKNSLQPERNEAIPNFLLNSDYDIMFFQEAFTATFRESMTKRLGAKYPYQYYQNGSSFMYPFFGSGIFVMSRRPFEVLEEIHFKNCKSFDCFAAKGSLVVETQLSNGRTVQFAPTHLNAGKQDPRVRVSQLTEMREMLVRSVKAGVPQVVIGDLNIFAYSDEFKNALELMQMDSVELTGAIKTTNARINDCYKTPKVAGWIDHVWVSRESWSYASKMTVVPTEFSHRGKTCPLSDHHALEAVLTFN